MRGDIPELTAMRRAGPGRVALEVDGRPWRVVGDEVVLRAGLALGMTLDRPALRELRAEIRRAEGMRFALRALERSDPTVRRLESRLVDRVGPAAAREVVGALRKVEVLDDRRVARRRAERLAERGWGDEAILARLAGEGIDEAVARDVLSGLEPERSRAERVPAKRLAARGFSAETIEAVLGLVE